MSIQVDFFLIKKIIKKIIKKGTKNKNLILLSITVIIIKSMIDFIEFLIQRLS